MAPAGRRGPSLRAQWLGKLLREHRERAGLKLAEAGEYIQRDQSTLSRMEAGIVPPRVPDVLSLLNLYGVDDEKTRDALEQLCRDVFRKGWWEGYSGQLSDLVVDYAWLEDRARSIRSFDALAVPGPLQTRPYAEAVIRATVPDWPPAMIAQGLDFRMTRQQVLTKADAPSVATVIDEGVLRRPIGGGSVMRDQLDRLAEVAAWPHVEVRVLPFAAGAHGGHDWSFTLLDLPEPFTAIGYTDTPAGGLYVEAEPAEHLRGLYDRLHDVTLGTAESLDLIAAARDRL